MTFDRFFHLTAAGIATLGLAVAAFPTASQAQGAASAEARSRMVCGSGNVVSATYLPGGLLQVTCEQKGARPSNTGSQANNGLGTGGLGSSTIGVTAVISGVVLGIAAGGSSGTTSGSSQGGSGGE